jgi:hypothetical protein
MLTKNQDIRDLSITSLFNSEDKYLIPIYQRNYEWEDKQIVQLIEDIKDYYLEENDKLYYIGTLIVDFRKTDDDAYFETIDGQQRLTTFNIIVCVLKQLERERKLPESIIPYLQKTNIHFESRPNSEKTITFIFKNGKNKPNFTDYNVNIVNAVDIIYRQLLQLIEKFSSATKERGWEEKTFEGFLNYLFNKVLIVRVQVPLDTDLNHYFEIMNSRGEQLEKHEILKSRLMKELNKCENAKIIRKQFNLIWEACSQMDTYVQLLFPKDFRVKLFGDRWFQYIPKDHKEMYTILDGFSEVFKPEIDGLSFSEIINENPSGLHVKIEELYSKEIVNDSDSKQYQHVVNFENFLLHVLKLQMPEVRVSLDDKRLLSFFKIALEKAADKEIFVKEFSYLLLKTRFLLDQYVIKRKYVTGEDFWSLEVLKFYPKVENVREKESYNYVNTFSEKDKARVNEEMILLLSMFHVSTPTQVYKNWLFETLKYLNTTFDFNLNRKSLENPININVEDYKVHLINIARKYLKYRFLNAAGELSYEEMFYEDLNSYKVLFDEELLNYGKVKNNLVFNYIDYLLWIKNPTNYSNFEFGFRSSVEHFYPQNPISGEKISDEKILNCIGNLCLISHSNNSRMSNFLPIQKASHYLNSKTKESIKQIVMMEIMDKKNNKWYIDEIVEHNNEIIELLIQDIHHA